jgi:hypothetical protein
MHLEQPEQEDRSDLNRHNANQRLTKRRGRRRWRLSRACHLGVGQVGCLVRAWSAAIVSARVYRKQGRGIGREQTLTTLDSRVLSAPTRYSYPQ